MASVPCSCKSANKLAAAACKKPISTAIFFFSYLAEYTYFYKMKTFKISYKKVKISILPRGGNFLFSGRDESYVYLKKISPRGEFHLA